MPSRCQAPIIEATSAITQSPISAMIPVCSAIGMKVFGMRMPSRGWFQRSSASAPVISPVTRLSLRLEGEQEFAALDRFGQRILGFDLFLMLGRQLVVEQAMLPAAARLGAIHRDVGGAHQRFDAAAMLGAQGDPDRGADVDAVAVQLERLGNRQRDPPGDPLDLRGRRDFGEEQSEFVAGEPRQQRPAGWSLR